MPIWAKITSEWIHKIISWLTNGLEGGSVNRDPLFVHYTQICQGRKLDLTQHTKMSEIVPKLRETCRWNEKLEVLLPHSFIAWQQSSFQVQLKAGLQPGECLVMADFSENYSFVLQDAAQGFHWNNSQATIHPFVAYYMKSGELHHLSCHNKSESWHCGCPFVSKTIYPILEKAV